MNENLDKEMKELRREIADDLRHPQRNEDIHRRKASLEFKSSGKFLILGGAGILVLVVLIAILSGGGHNLSTEALSNILIRIDHLEERLARLEGVVARVDLLENQEKQLQQSLIETDKSRRHLTQRLDELTKRFDTVQGERAPVAGRVAAPARIQRKPISLGKRRYHEVRAGESLYRIARRYGMSLDELCRLNNITPDHVIHPGQKLLVAPRTSQ